VPEDFSSGMLPAGKAALRVTVAPNLAMEASIVGNVRLSAGAAGAGYHRLGLAPGRQPIYYCW